MTTKPRILREGGTIECASSSDFVGSPAVTLQGPIYVLDIAPESDSDGVITARLMWIGSDTPVAVFLFNARNGATWVAGPGSPVFGPVELSLSTNDEPAKFSYLTNGARP